MDNEHIYTLLGHKADYKKLLLIKLWHKKQYLNFTFSIPVYISLTNTGQQDRYRIVVWYHSKMVSFEMGQYRLQEYQCIMSKVWRYSDASLLKSIRSLSILYDHESDKIISSSINSKLLPYCTRVFSTKMSFWNFIHYTKHFIDRYTTIHWYIDASILHLQYQYTHWNIMYYNASMHHSITPSL